MCDKKPVVSFISDLEKIKRYNELQRWYWWLERRTHEGETNKINIETFLRGIKNYFEPYRD